MHRFWNMCIRQVHGFPNFLIYLYRNEPIEIVPGAWFLIHMHPVCAQNKSLISNTVLGIIEENHDLTAGTG